MRHDATEFAKQLLAADSGFGSTEANEQRQKLFARLEAAERKERRGRKIAIGFCAASLVITSLLFFVTTQKIDTTAWTDPAKFVAVTAIIMFPVSALLILSVYLFSHRRSLRAARHELERQALADLPKQIAELRRELKDLRARAGEKSGFTLMEMLVAVGVITILAGMMFPALSRTKSTARSISCVNNLSQIGKALLMYESDEKAFPGAGKVATSTNLVITKSPESWDERLLPFLAGHDGVYWCPGYRPGKVGPYTVNAYGYNAYGSNKYGDYTGNLGLGADADHGLVKASEVTAPSDMVGIGDLQLPPGVWDNSINPTSRNIGVVDSFIPSRHGAGANVVFADGHVEHQPKKLWIAATAQSRRRWNNDNQPHAEGWK